MALMPMGPSTTLSATKEMSPLTAARREKSRWVSGMRRLERSNSALASRCSALVGWPRAAADVAIADAALEIGDGPELLPHAQRARDLEGRCVGRRCADDFGEILEV